MLRILNNDVQSIELCEKLRYKYPLIIRVEDGDFTIDIDELYTTKNKCGENSIELSKLEDAIILGRNREYLEALNFKNKKKNDLYNIIYDNREWLSNLNPQEIEKINSKSDKCKELGIWVEGIGEHALRVNMNLEYATILNYNSLDSYKIFNVGEFKCMSLMGYLKLKQKLEILTEKFNEIGLEIDNINKLIRIK